MCWCHQTTSHCQNHSLLTKFYMTQCANIWNHHKYIWQNFIKENQYEKFHYFHICVWLCWVCPLTGIGYEALTFPILMLNIKVKIGLLNQLPVIMWAGEGMWQTSWASRHQSPDRVTGCGISYKIIQIMILRSWVGPNLAPDSCETGSGVVAFTDLAAQLKMQNYIYWHTFCHL